MPPYQDLSDTYDMKITVLSDNIGNGELQGEWGLSFHIEFNGKKYLLDTGGSGLFLTNADKLGIDISDVDCAVLSHAHYDHSLGMEAFFSVNSKADFFVSPNARENCYAGLGFLSRYIGMPKGVLSKYGDRIKSPCGVSEIDTDVFIVPHSTDGLDKTGRRSHMYIRCGWRYVPDDFAHEQSLVFRTGDGLVIFNSCSHSGADVVMAEVGKAFPGEKVKAYLGGLHLFRMNEHEVREMAGKIQKAGIAKVVTGHCTGDKAYEILKSCLGETVSRFHCGMVMEDSQNFLTSPRP